MLKLALGTLDPDEIFCVVGISLSISESLEEGLWLECSKKIINWDFINGVNHVYLAEEILDFLLGLLRDLSSLLGVDTLGNFDNSIVREFSSNSSNLIFLKLDFLSSVSFISFLLGSSLLNSIGVDSISSVGDND